MIGNERDREARIAAADDVRRLISGMFEDEAEAIAEILLAADADDDADEAEPGQADSDIDKAALERLLAIADEHLAAAARLKAEPDEAEPTELPASNVVSIVPRGAAKSAPPRSSEVPDYEEPVLLVAGPAGEEVERTPTEFRLALAGRSAVVFKTPDSDSSVSVQAKDLAPEWRGILIGKYKFRFIQESENPDWTRIHGLSLRTLRGAATGATDEAEREIQAQPF
jgi:hypothetical protein